MNTVGKDPDDDRVPEKALMSKGLGISYLTDSMYKYHKDDPSRPITMLATVKLAYHDITAISYLLQLRTGDVGRCSSSSLKKYDRTIDPLYPQRVKKMYNDKAKKISKNGLGDLYLLILKNVEE